MYCKKCGKEIPDNSIYCSFCGTKQISQNKYIEYIKYIKWNPNIIRNIIFSIIVIIKKVKTLCLPFLIKILIICTICCGIEYSPLDWYQFFTEDIPEESYVDYQEFKRNCVSVTKEYLRNGELEFYQYNLIRNPYDYLHRWEYDEKVFNNINWVKDSYITTEREYVLADIEQNRKQNIECALWWILGIYFIVCITKKLVMWTLAFKNWLYKGREKNGVESTYVKGSKAWNRYINILTFKTILCTSLIVGGGIWMCYIIDAEEREEDLIPYIFVILLIFLCVFIWKRFNRSKKEKH